jgi:hypothetical protein
MSSKAKLPSVTEMADLPLWARVSFAARCGRRVQEIFEVWAGSNENFKKAGDRALRTTESAADKAATPTDYNAEEMAVVVTASRKERAPYYASKAIFAAVQAALHANEDEEATKYALKSAFDSVKAISDDTRDETGDSKLAREVEAEAKQQVRDDFDFLVKQAKERNWDEFSKVPWTLFQVKSVWPKYRENE